MMRFALCLFFCASVQGFAPQTRSASTVLDSSITPQDLMGSHNRLHPAWTSVTLGSTDVVDRVLYKVTAVSRPRNQPSTTQGTKNSYVRFAQQNPFLNNLLIATTKAGLADAVAQIVLGGAAFTQLHLSRSALFMVFGAVYGGAFQWLYQVCLFSKLFGNVDRFTQQSWRQKLRDRAGLANVVAQTAMDLAVLGAAYLPAFYIFQASVFGGTNPMEWLRAGLTRYQDNFASDALKIVRIWLPADLLCFSVPLYLRLPVRHGIGFAWMAYLSFLRGGL